MVVRTPYDNLTGKLGGVLRMKFIWNQISETERNKIADIAIGDRIGISKYHKIIHSRFEDIDAVNQKRIVEHMLKVV